MDLCVSTIVFLIFQSCGEPFSIGVSTIRSLLGHPGLFELIFGQKNMEVVSDEEKEFSSDVQLFPDQLTHSMSSADVDTSFLQLEKLKSIIETHSSILFGSFDSQGLKTEPYGITASSKCSLLGLSIKT